MSFRASNGCEPCACDADEPVNLVKAIERARDILQDYEEARIEYREFEARA